MKFRLMTSTAMGALLATSSYVSAEEWGVRVFGGLNFLGDESFDATIVTDTEFAPGGRGRPATQFTYGAYMGFDFDMDMGYVFGGAINYQWEFGLILEVEAAYRKNDLDVLGSGVAFYRSFTTSTGIGTNKTSGTIAASGDGDISVVSLMANAWYEFGLGNDKWHPYIGGGVGMAWLDIDGTIAFSSRSTPSDTPSTGVVDFDGDNNGFAWQVGGGIGYEISPGMQVTLDYRYFNGPDYAKTNGRGDVFNGIVIGEPVPLDRTELEKINEADIGGNYVAHSIMLGIKIDL